MGVGIGLGAHFCGLRGMGRILFGFFFKGGREMGLAACERATRHAEGC